MPRRSSMIQSQVLLRIVVGALACAGPSAAAFAFATRCAGGHRLALSTPTSSSSSSSSSNTFLYPLIRRQSKAYHQQQTLLLATTSSLLQASSQEEEGPGSSNTIENSSVGLYRPFAEHAWSKLLVDTDWFVEDTSVPSELSSNTAPAKGLPEGSVVNMEVKALRPKGPSKSLIRYARYALLETLVPSTSDKNNNSTGGIQVLNLVVFPAASTNLPVFGADLVSLPGNRHLLLLDAQPMDSNKGNHQQLWNDWYQTHVVGTNNNREDQSFPWGGDIPEEVAKYVSDNALWARLIGGGEGDTGAVDPVAKIQTALWEAYQEHLDLYLELLSNYDAATPSPSSSNNKNLQEPYIDYRLNNDPARPMLKSLYGEEWTERVLHEVLFPNE